MHCKHNPRRLNQRDFCNFYLSTLAKPLQNTNSNPYCEFIREFRFSRKSCAGCHHRRGKARHARTDPFFLCSWIFVAIFLRHFVPDFLTVIWADFELFHSGIFFSSQMGTLNRSQNTRKIVKSRCLGIINEFSSLYDDYWSQSSLEFSGEKNRRGFFRL